MISSSAAAGVVVLISLCIEVCGGKVGGILSSIPHLAVVGAVGLYASLSKTDYRLAMLGMTLGFLANSFWLAAVVVCSLKLQDKYAGMKKLILVFFIATFIYTIVLIALLWIFKVSSVWQTGAWFVAIGCWVVELIIGLWLTRFNHPATDGKSKCSTWDILLRAAITFVIFMFALWLASISPALGGSMVNAPVIRIVVLGGIWLAHGEEVVVGTCGHMTLGLLSASAFALLGAWLIPDYSLAFGVGVSWTASVMFITVPQLVLVSRERKLRKEIDSEDSEKISLEQGMEFLSSRALLSIAQVSPEESQ